MSPREIADVLTRRRLSTSIKQPEAITLGRIFWSVPADENLARRVWPEYFRPERGAA
jgi:hypothetical protein